MNPFSGTAARQIAGFSAIILIAVISLAIVNAKVSVSQGDRELAELEQADARDSFGGKTPEETISLFREALVAKDFDLAAKYFVPDKQREMRAKFDTANKNKVIPNLIQLLELHRNGTALTAETYQYSIPVENSQFILDLVLNPNSGVWKLDAF